MAIRRLCSVHLASGSWPFWLIFPIPLCPIGGHILCSDQTQALKSPSISRGSLFDWGVDNQLIKSSIEVFLYNIIDIKCQCVCTGQMTEKIITKLKSGYHETFNQTDKKLVKMFEDVCLDGKGNSMQTSFMVGSTFPQESVTTTFSIILPFAGNLVSCSAATSTSNILNSCPINSFHPSGPVSESIRVHTFQLANFTRVQTVDMV